MSPTSYNLEMERGDPFGLKSKEIIKKEKGTDLTPKKKKRNNKKKK